MRTSRDLAALCCAAFLSVAVAAEIRRVPSDYATIQAGIDAAQTGDVVLVADGVYTGLGNKNLTLNGKDLVLRSENGPQNCIIDCEGEGRGFHMLGGEPLGAAVEGFSVRHGAAVGGAGIACGPSDVVFRRCIVENNNACPGGGGGGVEAYRLSSTFSGPSFEDCIIRNNTAAIGAGVSTGGAQFYRCTIADNYVCTDHPYSNGGGVLLWGDDTVSRFVDCVFVGNSAYKGGAVYASNYSRALLVRCVIADNRAAYFGGGVYAYEYCDFTLLDCVITGNSTPWYGGGVFVYRSTPLIQNCTITGNVADWAGGGIFAYDHGTPVIEHTIVAENAAILGCEIGADGESTPRLRFADIPTGPAWGWFDDASYLDWDTPNMDADPQFIDPDGPDNDALTWDDNDYRLSAGSPCIDAGDPALTWRSDNLFDVRGHVRVWDGDGDGSARMDIGAFEHRASCPGDTDGDGIIGIADLATTLSNFGDSAGAQDGDTNADGIVDLEDLAAVLGAFGGACE